MSIQTMRVNVFFDADARTNFLIRHRRLQLAGDAEKHLFSTGMTFVWNRIKPFFITQPEAQQDQKLEVHPGTVAVIPNRVLCKVVPASKEDLDLNIIHIDEEFFSLLANGNEFVALKEVAVTKRSREIREYLIDIEEHLSPSLHRWMGDVIACFCEHLFDPMENFLRVPERSPSVLSAQKLEQFTSLPPSDFDEIEKFRFELESVQSISDLRQLANERRLNSSKLEAFKFIWGTTPLEYVKALEQSWQGRDHHAS